MRRLLFFAAFFSAMLPLLSLQFERTRRALAALPAGHPELLPWDAAARRRRSAPGWLFRIALALAFLAFLGYAAFLVELLCRLYFEGYIRYDWGFAAAAWGLLGPLVFFGRYWWTEGYREGYLAGQEAGFYEGGGEPAPEDL